MNLWLYLLIINLATLVLYKLDKMSSRNGGARIPEYILLLVGFLGGTIAALVAQQLFRHKTRKLSFQFKFWALTMLQLALLALQPPELMRLLSALQS